MSFITDLFSSGASSLVDSVGNAIDKNTTTVAEKMQLTQEEQKAEYQYNIENKKLDVEEQKAFLEDTANSRAMNIQIQESEKASWLSKNVTPVLGLGTTLLCFIIFGFVIFKKMAPETKDVVIYLLGVLSAIVGQIFSFYFGSSQGSQNKNDIIKNINK